ncbi:hypothetical protein CHELA1G11_50079 [Hyphomicrobiales bacterium]|nr:hypothetical protein CHELA1G11_50079 [Hyphomicrobiales bacterium]
MELHSQLVKANLAEKDFFLAAYPETASQNRPLNSQTATCLSPVFRYPGGRSWKPPDAHSVKCAA